MFQSHNSFAFRPQNAEPFPSHQRDWYSHPLRDPVCQSSSLAGVSANGSRLDTDFIVLRGEENEASSQLLKGVVVLCLPAALKVEDVHLRMIGQLKVG